MHGIKTCLENKADLNYLKKCTRNSHGNVMPRHALSTHTHLKNYPSFLKIFVLSMRIKISGTEAFQTGG